MKLANLQAAEAALKPFYDNARPKYNVVQPYTLDVMRQLMTYLGNPQDSYKVVHIAGTSGKTSTAYYAAALLTQAGYKTGLTVSPHVDTINERVQIDGSPVNEADFSVALGEFIDIVQASGIKPSWFEILVAFAYWYFAKAHVDYAVIEVGLGGLLDGTNVVSRADKVCVITDIGLDHTNVLGNTLAEIAAQKAGILQPHNTGFCYEQAAEVMRAFHDRADAQQAELHVLKTPLNYRASITDLPLFQQRNFTLAAQAIEYALGRDKHTPLSEAQLDTAAHIIVPGRMEELHTADKTIILDGSHNAQKLEALRGSLTARFPGVKPVILAAFIEGDTQRYKDALKVLADLSSSVILTDFYSEKDFKKYSVDPQVVARLCLELGIEAKVIPGPANAYAYMMTLPDELCVVTGSFYLLNHIRPLMLGI